jgi:hypothetical protein
VGGTYEVPWAHQRELLVSFGGGPPDASEFRRVMQEGRIHHWPTRKAGKPVMDRSVVATDLERVRRQGERREQQKGSRVFHSTGNLTH